MQFHGQITKVRHGTAGPALNDCHTEECWNAKRSSLECSDRNEDSYGSRPGFVIKVGFNAHGRLAPLIIPRIPRLFSAVVDFPFDRCACSFVLQEELQTHIR